MITTIILAITLGIPVPACAVRVHRSEGDYLNATFAGHRYKVPEITNLFAYCKERNHLEGTHDELKYQGMTYHVVHGSLVDQTDRVILNLKPEATECLGGIEAHGAMFWFLQISEESDYGTYKPVTFAHVYVIKEIGGKLKLVKDIDVRQLIGWSSYYVPIKRFGDLVFMGGQSDSYALFNLRSMSAMGLAKSFQPVSPIRDTYGSAISNSGRVYHQDGQRLLRLDWPSLTWKTIRQLSSLNEGESVMPIHDWITAVGIGNDDLLIANDWVTFANSHDCYVPEQKITDQTARVQVFVRPGVAVGIVWQYNNEHWEKPKNEKGILLKLSTLEPLCPISMSKGP